MAKKESADCLVCHSPDSYGDSFVADLLEQYKLYVQTAENNSARRVASTRFCLTISTALVALFGLQLEVHKASNSPMWWAIFVPMVGLFAAFLWLRIIKSYRQLNEIKFQIIHELESHFPASLFKFEWKLAKQGKGSTYRPVTNVERWIPFGFIAIHTIQLLYLIFTYVVPEIRSAT